jgi:hypothetical protein
MKWAGAYFSSPSRTFRRNNPDLTMRVIRGKDTSPCWPFSVSRPFFAVQKFHRTGKKLKQILVNCDLQLLP